MSWLSSVMDGIKRIGYGLKNGAEWIWNNATISRVGYALVTYTANTIFQMLEEIRLCAKRFRH